MPDGADRVTPARATTWDNCVDADEDVVLSSVHRSQPPLTGLALHPRYGTDTLGDTAFFVRLQENGDPVRRLEHGPQKSDRRVTICSGHRILWGRVHPCFINARSAENLSSLSSDSRRNISSALSCNFLLFWSFLSHGHLNGGSRMLEPTPKSPARQARRRRPKPPGSLPPIVCERCGGPVTCGQRVDPLFSAKLVRWSEHPVLSQPPV